MLLRIGQITCSSHTIRRELSILQIPQTIRLRSHCLRTRKCASRIIVPSSISEQNEESDLEFAIQPEDDWTVPGGYQESLRKNSKLGKAVDDACKELGTLGELERDSLVKANQLLKKLGYKGDITAPQIPPKITQEDREP